MIFLASCKLRNVACLQLICVERSDADKSIVVLVIFIALNLRQVTKSADDPWVGITSFLNRGVVMLKFAAVASSVY